MGDCGSNQGKWIDKEILLAVEILLETSDGIITPISNIKKSQWYLYIYQRLALITFIGPISTRGLHTNSCSGISRNYPRMSAHCKGSYFDNTEMS